MINFDLIKDKNNNKPLPAFKCLVRNDVQKFCPFENTLNLHEA